MREDGVLYYLLGDHLGSTGIVTFENGNLVSQTKYKAWGEVRLQSGPSLTEYTFTGQYSYTGSFGLIYYNARWFDPSLGRFAQADSIIPLQQGVQAWDRYAYANNNPVLYNDPSGHFVPCNILCAGIPIVNISEWSPLAKAMTVLAASLIGLQYDNGVIRTPNASESGANFGPIALLGGPLDDAGKIAINSFDSAIPKGFNSVDEFQEFGTALKNGLQDAGYTDVVAAFQGSSVTGVKYTTGEAFDVGRVSDFDIALTSPTLLAKAKELGIPLRAGGIWTGPLSPEDIEMLGLSDLVEQLTEKAGRPVNFMIFDGIESALKKAPSIKIREPY